MAHQKHGEQVSLDELRNVFRRPDGSKMSRQGMQYWVDKILHKVRSRLLMDEEIRSLLKEMGYELDE